MQAPLYANGASRIPLSGVKHMTDWGFATQIALGGFALVFILLAMLAGLVWTGARILARLAKNKTKA